MFPDDGLNYVQVGVPHSLRRRFKREMTKKCPDWGEKTYIRGDSGFSAGGKDRGYETMLMPVELERYLGRWFRFLRWIWHKRFGAFV